MAFTDLKNNNRVVINDGAKAKEIKDSNGRTIAGVNLPNTIQTTVQNNVAAAKGTLGIISGAQKAAQAAAAAAESIKQNASVPKAVTTGGGGSGSGSGSAASTPTQSAAAYLAELEKQRPQHSTSDYVSQLLQSLQQAETSRPGEYTASDAANALLQKLQQTENAKPGEYSESDAVKAALQALTAKEGERPEYTNTYQDRIDSMLDQILNRQAFNYNFNADPMYQQYAQKYQENGRQAMMDTMGQAAALTGGYGNSYATQVGQQAYQQNLANLNDVIPQLRDAAYQMYQNEGNDLRNNMALLRDLESTDYGRYRDDVSDYYTDLNYLYNRYQNESATDYDRYRDLVSQWQNDRTYDYNRYADQTDRDYRQWQDQMDQWNTDRAYAADRYDTENDREYNRYLDTVDQWNQDLNYWQNKAAIEAEQAAAASQAKKASTGVVKTNYKQLNTMVNNYTATYDDILNALKRGDINEKQADALGKKLDEQNTALYG